MNWKDLGTEKRLVALTFIFLVSTFAVTGFIMERTVEVTQYGGETTRFDGDLPIEYNQLGENSSGKLKAIVKGSIYEEGDNMTVYGACFDGDGYLLPEANALFTAWYPNGTIVTGPNATMDRIYEDFQGTAGVNGTGRWKIHVVMGDTVGTYLTEMRCIYEDEWAVAFGEWQNPAWVVRIATIDERTANISQNLSDFRVESSGNFSAILDQLNGIEESGTATDEDLRELSESLRTLDRASWTIDDTNPFFLLGSDAHNFKAVDMLNPDLIAAASEDGYFVYWDGETWSEEFTAANNYSGVSVLPANQVYAWAVGENGTDPIYTINGNNATSPTLPSGSPTSFTDVVLFQDPLNPTGNYYAFLMGDDGTVYESNDQGTSWTDIGSVGAADHGRFSEVVENYDEFAEPNGYMLLGGQGDTVFSYNGATYNTFSVVGDVKDTALLYSDYGYVLVENSTHMVIYKWNGTGLTEDFAVADASIIPTAVDLHSKRDVWVSTQDPGTFFHFDGRHWEYSTFGYSEFVSIVVNLNGGGGGGGGTTTGVIDMTMSDPHHGYAVGGDGLILEYRSDSEQRFRDLLSELENLSSELNLTEVLLENAIENLLNVTLDVNQSIIDYVGDVNQTLVERLSEINTTVGQINLTVEETAALLQAMNITLEQFETATLGNLSSLQELTEKETYFTEGWESGLIAGSWTSLTGTQVLNNDTGFGDYEAGGEEMGVALQWTASGDVNLTDPAFTTLTTEQKFDDVTYEAMFYVEDAMIGQTIGQDEIYQWAWSYDWYNPALGVRDTGTELRFFVEDYDKGNEDLYSQALDQGWHTMQAHWYAFDGENATLSVYLDGKLVGMVEDQASIGNYNLDEFLIWGNSDFENNSMDNIKIYEGGPGMNAIANNFKFLERNLLENITVEFDLQFDEIRTELLALNASLQTELQNIDDFLADMNASFDLKLDNIIGNVTYTQLYLETTLFPLINNTYENTLLILQQLGVIETTLNETRDIANETRTIVNESAGDIDELVNRSRRIRAWITQ